MKAIRNAIIFILMLQLFGVIEHVDYTLAISLYLGSLVGSFLWGGLLVIGGIDGDL